LGKIAICFKALAAQFHAGVITKIYFALFLEANPTSLETISARYITPENISIMTKERACGVIGKTSPSPVPERMEKLKNNISTQVLGDSLLSSAVKLPGYHCWQTR
jgi:hypothetical protein